MSQQRRDDPSTGHPDGDDGRLATGIDVLDEQLAGGIAPGRVVVLSAAPASQSDLFLAQLTTTRETLYLTTQHSASAIESFLDDSHADLENCTVRKVDTESPLESAHRQLQALPEGGNLVVDSMNPLETAAPSSIAQFVNALRERLEDAGALCLLNCVTGHAVPGGRETTEYMADVIFHLETETAKERIDNRLYVPKVRGDRAIERPIKLELTDRIAVDTSRDIA